MTSTRAPRTNVRSTKNGEAVGLGQALDVVAVTPDAGPEALKVGGVVTFEAVLAVEGDGLAGEGPRADELAGLARRLNGHGRVLGGVHDVDGHAEGFALDFAGVDGQEWCSTDDCPPLAEAHIF